jgi:SAM-dependent methyltransferase
MADEGEGVLASVTDFQPGVSSEALYDDWAATYDSDLVDRYGYNSPGVAAGRFADMLSDKSGAVIDYGCGTGLVGEALATHGFDTIDGFDLSHGMLDVAAGKGVYRDLVRGDLTAPLPFVDASYAGATCVGSMGNGHIEPEHLVGLIRTVRSGGPIIVYSNAKPFDEDGYETRLRALESAGWWTIEQITRTNYMDALDRPGCLIIARRQS